MSRKPRTPGDFSHRSLGVSKHVHTGWRDFHADWSQIEDPNNQVDSVATTAAGIVVTYTDIQPGETAIHEMACIAIPILNKYGEEVTFSDAFMVKTQVEFISISGDHGAFDDDKHTPVFGLGICKNKDDIDGTSSANKFLGRGLYNKENDGSGNPKFRTYVGKSNLASGSAQGDSSNLGTATKHVISDFFIGPAVGSTTNDNQAAWMIGWAGDNKTGSYAKNTNINIHHYGITHADAQFDSDGTAYLFAFFGCVGVADGSNDPAVVTCKLRYMCTSNRGKGGSGVL